MFRFFVAIFLAFSSAAHAGVDALCEPNVAWTKRKIHVCWQPGGNDFETEQRLAVQKIVEQEYKIERVGITFFGWEDCSTLAPEEYDIAIIQDRDVAPTNAVVDKYRKIGAEGYAVLGQGSAEQIKTDTDTVTLESKKTRGFFNRNLQHSVVYLMYRPVFRLFSESFKANEELQLTALHEFGHVAGMRHEHIRFEAKDDPNCKNRTDAWLVEDIMDTAVAYTAYDPNSVMNFCWGATLAKNGNVVNELPNVPDETMYSVVTDKKTKTKTYTLKIGLSTKDISTLRRLYPKNP